MAVCDKCCGTGEVPDDESAQLSEAGMIAECRRAGKQVFRGFIVKVPTASFLTGLSEGRIRNMMSSGELTTIHLTANSVGVSIRQLVRLGEKK